MMIGETINLDDLFSIRDKVAVITGGSRGIGLMIAEGYVKAGAKVYIVSRKKEACDEAATLLSEWGQVTAVAADVAIEEDRRKLVETVAERESMLHILVNNAGTNWGAPFEEYPDTGTAKVMRLNVESLFALTRDFTPLLKAAGTAADPARVINIGSIDGIRVPHVENYAYAASKAAVHHLTRVLAAKLGPQHVTVNAVAPGPFESKMTEWLLDNFREGIEEACPLGRIGRPEDMAGIAIYLASRAGGYLNGVTVPVDGGISLK